MEEKHLLKADFITSIVLVIFGALVMVESWRMPRFEELKVNPYSVPGLVPGILGFMFFFLGGIMLVRSIRKGGYQLQLNRNMLKTYFADDGNQRLILTLGLCLLYTLGMIGFFPYALSTGIFVLLFICLFEYGRKDDRKTRGKKLLAGLIQAVLVAVVVTYVFQELFLVKLP